MVFFVSFLHSSTVEAHFWLFRCLRNVLALDECARLTLIEGAADSLYSSLLNRLWLHHNDGLLVPASLLLRFDELIADPVIDGNLLDGGLEGLGLRFLARMGTSWEVVAIIVLLI
jgi:hypothetical protein